MDFDIYDTDSARYFYQSKRSVGGNNQKQQQSATRWDDRKYMYFAPNNITSLTKVNVVDGWYISFVYYIVMFTLSHMILRAPYSKQTTVDMGLRQLSQTRDIQNKAHYYTLL